MTSLLRTPDWTVDDELFPPSWLLSEPMLDRINRAAIGIGLFDAVRYDDAEPVQPDHLRGPITDFRYAFINPVLAAMARVTREDCVSLPLSALIPEGVRTELIDRMAQVVETGRPQHHNDVFGLDGVVTQHDQLCLKVGDGVLVLVMDVTYRPLSDEERQRRSDLLEAMLSGAPVDAVRGRFMALIT